MGLNGEMCNNNSDCPIAQYCYNISKRCVDYLDCNRYNRLKGQIAAQEPSQCGPCMKGYVSEILATGQETLSCKYAENQTESDIYQLTAIIVIIVIVIAFIAALLLYYIFYKRHRAHRIRKSMSNNASIASNNSKTIVVASAPPEEEKPFMGFREKRFCILDNNSKKITEEYQTTVPYTAQLRHINAYAPTNNSHINNNSNSNNNLLSREVTNIEMAENQHDRNIERSQNDQSNHNDDNQSNHNIDDDGDTIDFASEPNNKGDKKKSGLIINQLVQQNITINVNGEEY